jgi:mono/diheme cytochrome c family protein
MMFLMKCLFVSLAALALTLVGRVSAELPQPTSAFLDQHCAECHDADVKKGGLDLGALKFELANADAFLGWQKVFERVRDGEMPPKKKPQPEKADADKFLASLKPALVKADTADIAANGRVRSRRLTRTEYENTMHDLLGIDMPLKVLLPEDRASYGFETVAAGQQLSQHLLARYLDVADLALTDAFQRALKGDETFQKHYTPDMLTKNRGGNYRGPDLRDGRSISWPMTLQFSGRTPTYVPDGGWYRITLHGVQAINPGSDGAVWGTLRSGECESNAPMLYMIGLVEATSTPRDMVYEAWIQQGHRLELRPNDANYKHPQSGAKGGNVSFQGRDLAKEGYAGIAHTGIDMERIYPNSDRVKLMKNLFGEEDVKTADAATLDKLITRFARRAFRRPVTEEQTAAYCEIARKALAEGDEPTEALRMAYRAILCSPRFLTFIEAPGPLDDHAIASRLSYALWVSMPDYKLTQLANEKKLHDPEVLAQQVERLLAHPKAERFVTSFTDQWLKLKEIDFTTPDTRQFPTFDSVVQESMLQETRAYFAELIKHDLGISHLVESDFAFLNGRLARHYHAEVPLTPGDGLQKVVLTDKDIRGGLITQGAILKVTADGTSTSPVVRGVFINERILGNRIPPPPPGVPAIEPDIRGATSIRDQLDKHRNNESCASCHQTIDPPGFALENYDPVGVWRTGYGKNNRGAKVDPSGTTPEGGTFKDIHSWQRLYAQNPDQLARGFATHFLTYSTGAALRFSDETALDKVISTTAEKGHGMRSVIRAAVLSEIFLTK